MKELFNPDSKLMCWIGRVGDHFLLSLLWLVCSLPVVTMGAASAAMCQISFRLLDAEECHLTKDFFTAFKQHFKAATKLWLAALLILAVFVLDVLFYLQLGAASGTWASLVLGMIMMFALVFVLCLLWLYPYVTLFSGEFTQAVKMSFLLGMTNLGWTAVMLVLDIALVFVSLFASFLLPFLPGLITFANTLCIRRALEKYRKAEEV